MVSNRPRLPLNDEQNTCETATSPSGTPHQLVMRRSLTALNTRPTNELRSLPSCRTETCPKHANGTAAIRVGLRPGRPQPLNISSCCTPLSVSKARKRRTGVLPSRGARLEQSPNRVLPADRCSGQCSWSTISASLETVRQFRAVPRTPSNLSIRAKSFDFPTPSGA